MFCFWELKNYILILYFEISDLIFEKLKILEIRWISRKQKLGESIKFRSFCHHRQIAMRCRSIVKQQKLRMTIKETLDVPSCGLVQTYQLSRQTTWHNSFRYFTPFFPFAALHEIKKKYLNTSCPEQ